jgi:hypothetical protein
MGLHWFVGAVFLLSFATYFLAFYIHGIMKFFKWPSPPPRDPLLDPEKPKPDEAEKLTPEDAAEARAKAKKAKKEKRDKRKTDKREKKNAKGKEDKKDKEGEDDKETEEPRLPPNIWRYLKEAHEYYLDWKIGRKAKKSGAKSRPANSGPAESGSAESTPAESTPAESRPANSGPADSGPSEITPTDSQVAASGVQVPQTPLAEGSSAEKLSTMGATNTELLESHTGIRGMFESIRGLLGGSPPSSDNIDGDVV